MTDSRRAITGIHHFASTVRDVEASAQWYQEVFGLERVPVTFPHHEREETGYAVLLIDPKSGLAFGLHQNTGNQGEKFDECRTGLDHIGFNVADRAEMDRWAEHLTSLGVEHTGIRDITGPITFSTLVFRDPDNIQLEFFTMGQPG
ncbi:MAG TPA: VOC family protein [Acidimicrobiales bacterium]|nr:VOC family protein [Acidimicrobiales bacterium]